ncbi:MAG: cory-CC-star protein [Ornithinimicrobium sp.]
MTPNGDAVPAPAGPRDWLHAVLAGKYRQTFARARQDEDDVVLMIILSEALGVPNPMSWYAIELLPVVYDRFHDWHRRIGLDHSPLDRIACC